MIQRLVVAGWLLVGQTAGTIAFYPDEATCWKAYEYTSNGFLARCIPDRHEFEEGGSLYEESKK